MTTETEEGGGEELSLRDALSEAVYGDRGDGGTEVATPAPKPEANAEPEPKTTAPAAPRADGRDEHGRFAPKTAAPAPAQAAPVAPDGQPTAQPAPTDAPRAPASWTAAAKAEFANLSPAIQAEISRREREIEQGFAQQQTRLELANRFDALVAPFKDRFAAEGVDPIQATQRLYAAQQFLEKNPVEGLLHLARAYGVHPARLAQAAGVQQPGAPQGQPAQLPPQFQAIAQEVQSLRAQLAQRTQAETAQRQQTVQNEITAFANDPANVYFHNVREDMIGLLQAGRATDLKDAYDKAVWANPETRTLLQAETAKKAEAERLNAQRQQTQGARRAAGSVSGSPSSGARAPAPVSNPNASVREDLLDSIRSLRA